MKRKRAPSEAELIAEAEAIEARIAAMEERLVPAELVAEAKTAFKQFTQTRWAALLAEAGPALELATDDEAVAIIQRITRQLVDEIEERMPEFLAMAPTLAEIKRRRN
jgi:hypothetical protein